nr:reverse transcriptase domain-containing protein [Tanacetum cinerariifolium]
MMSYPDHSTSNNEDAFSSNIPDYVPTILNYFPTFLGKTYSNASNNSTELLPPKKQIHPPSSSSTTLSKLSQKQIYTYEPSSPLVYIPTLPPLYEPGKGSIKMHLRHHEKQMTNILYYLEELSFHRIEKMRERFINDQIIIPGEFDELKIKLEKARSQLSVLQKKQLTPRNEIAFTHFRISNLENIIEEIRALFLRSKCAEEDRVTFVTGTLTNDALSWWNAYAQPIGIEQANKIVWTELKRLLTNKYCPRTKIKKMEDKFYNLVVKENDLKTYIRRFQELALLCPNMVPNSEKLMEVFIEGLPKSIERNVTASKPQTLEEVITITQRLMEQVIKHKSAQEVDDHKQKFEDRRNTTDNNNYQNNHNNHNRNNDYHQQQNKKQETFGTYTATNGYT